jgi:hypothetical protein
MVLARLRARSTTKIDSKNGLYRHRHFTEHLLYVFGKSSRNSDLNHKCSNLLSGDSKIIPCFLQQSTIGKTKSTKNRATGSDWRHLVSRAKSQTSGSAGIEMNPHSGNGGRRRCIRRAQMRTEEKGQRGNPISGRKTNPGRQTQW